jgi:hypothetical protein
MSTDGEPEMWANLLEGLSDLHDVVRASLPAPLDVARTALIEWRKVWDQLNYLVQGSAPTIVPQRYLEEALKAWDPLGPSSEDMGRCAYPRCPTVWLGTSPEEACFVCSRCCSAKYCSVRCQRR